jgi:hypothetical protein
LCTVTVRVVGSLTFGPAGLITTSSSHDEVGQLADHRERAAGGVVVLARLRNRSGRVGHEVERPNASAVLRRIGECDLRLLARASAGTAAARGGGDVAGSAS